MASTFADLKQERELLQSRVFPALQHRDFAVERRSVFFGRNSNRSTIESYIAGNNTWPLVLFGLSGLGKSALMAQAIGDAKASAQGVSVVYRFVGVTASSTWASRLELVSPMPGCCLST